MEDNREISNLIRLQKGGVEFKIFDYEYWGTLKDSEESTQAVCIARSARLNPKPFILEPRRLISLPQGRGLGYVQIEFPQYRKFSKDYKLHAENETAARRLFHDETIALLDDHPGLLVESYGSVLVISHPGKLVPVSHLKYFIDFTGRLYETLSGKS